MFLFRIATPCHIHILFLLLSCIQHPLHSMFNSIKEELAFHARHQTADYSYHSRAGETWSSSHPTPLPQQPPLSSPLAINDLQKITLTDLEKIQRDLERLHSLQNLAINSFIREEIATLKLSPTKAQSQKLAYLASIVEQYKKIISPENRDELIMLIQNIQHKAQIKFNTCIGNGNQILRELGANNQQIPLSINSHKK